MFSHKKVKQKGISLSCDENGFLEKKTTKSNKIYDYTIRI